MRKKKAPAGPSPPSDADGLEIVSIGSLLRSHKNYWSSSRGKDRYPYPVGYRAVRTHGEQTYTMEIREGSKGPLFVVASADGRCCSGRTPDMAWAAFQRKSVGNWHGRRRLSCVDGVELFGFRNPSVQRLLRGLVVDVAGPSDRSPISSDLANELSQSEDNVQRPELHPCPDLALFPGKENQKGRRKKRAACAVDGLASDNSLSHLERRLCSSKQSTASDSGSLDKNVSAAEPADMRPSDIPAGERIIASTVISVEECLQGNTSPPMELEGPAICEQAIAREESTRLLDAELNYKGLARIEDSERENPGLKNLESTNDINFRIPDMFDVTQEDCQRMIVDESKGPCSLDAQGTEEATTIANEIALPQCTTISNVDERNTHRTPVLVDSDGMLVTQPGLSMSCGSNSSTERADVDTPGQELARSMMTFLLPRAVPLLRSTYYRKKRRAKAKKEEHKPYFTNERGPTISKLHKHAVIEEEKLLGRDTPSMISSILGLDKVMDPPSDFGHDKVTEIECFENINAIIPDSYEDQSACVAAVPVSVCFGNGVNGSSADKVNCKTTEPAICSGSELYNAIPTYNDSICCKNNTFLDAVGKKNICSSSLMVSNTFQAPDPYSVGISSIGSKKDTLHLEFACASKHMQPSLQTSYKRDRNTSNLESQSRDCRLKRNNIEMLERSIFVPENSENRVDTNSKEEKRMGNSVANAGADVDITCLEIVEAKSIKYPADHHMPHADYNAETTPPEENCDSDRFAVQEPNLSSSKLQVFPCSVSFSGNDTDNSSYGSINAHDMPTLAFISGVKNDTRTYSASESRVTESSSAAVSISIGEFLPDAAVTMFVPQKEVVMDSVPSDMNANSIYCDVSKVELSKISLFGECKPDRIPSEYVLNDVIYPKEGIHLENMSSNKVVISHSHMYEENVVDHCPFFDLGTTKDCRFFLKPLGCYVLPSPILSILMDVKGEEIVVCVISGVEECSKREIFIFKFSAKQMTVHPSFLGYTSIFMTSQEGLSVANAKAFECSCIQFSPGAQLLLLHNSIKVPCCRERTCNCSCSLCDSDYCEESGIKIVDVKFGYVSIIKKLVTATRIYCMLVCEPNYLVASNGSGNLYGWKMGSSWRDILEDFSLPSFDEDLILELKRLPCQNTLIIGHNGKGSFGLWDVNTRVLLGKFSSRGGLTCQMFPVGVCRLIKDITSNSLNIEELESTDKEKHEALFCHKEESCLIHDLTDEGIALWILVLASSSFHDGNIQEASVDSFGWRLALLFENKAILGGILDPRVCSVESTSGQGIFGTRDGLLYIWKTSTGEKLMCCNPFNGGNISCIAADSKSGALIVAHENHMQVYFQVPNLVPQT